MSRPFPTRRVAFVVMVLALIRLSPGPVRSQGDRAGLFQDFTWRNIGPANMAGRVTDIEAVDVDPSTVVVAAASGGVWKSTNAGTTWQPIFEKYGSSNIGDVAIFQPNPSIIWVGTGESCTRNSVGWGDGVYKSTDGGKTFANVGLRDTHHISEVVTHPVNPDIVYVAAQGHLWAHTGERGVFKTIDGGKTWTRLGGGLPDDERTGASDLKMDSRNPDILYAGFWERLRKPYRFDSGGPNGGIFKSIDGGKTWRKLATGLPAGDTGKIGLAVYRRNPNTLVAIIEHGFQPAQRVGDKPNPDYDDTTKLGTGIYRSEDAGKTWKYINRYNNRPFYYSHIYINPSDDKLVYVLAGSAQVSEDGGRTFARSLPGISGDFHALWIDPNNRNRFYVGNDKGSYATYDHGRTFQMFDTMDIGQFYAVTLDSRDPYYVYGGLQDNGNWGGPSNSRDWNGILNDHWFKFHSGDGFHTTVDPNDWRVVYTESQGGNISRFDAVFRQRGKRITPTPRTVMNFKAVMPDFKGPDTRLPQGFRFNWSAALTLSPHDSRIVYFGGNHLFKSVDRGDTWTIISPDLSSNDPETTNPESGGLTRDVTSAETHATIITISESPLAPGLIWVGTDDGNVQLTRNGGGSWTNVRANIPEAPKGLWISRVVASRFAEGTAYAAIDGHRSDDFRPWVFKTSDYGKTWLKLSANLPVSEPVYVVTEDLKNPNLLFVGTEFAVHASIDGGKRWERFMANLPTVPVHDLVVHPRDGDLVAATHGRSVWIADDITPLQQITDQVIAADAHLFQNRVATIWRGVSRGATRGHMLFTGRNPLTIGQRPPGNSPSELDNSAAVHFYVKSAGKVTIEIGDTAGRDKHTASVDAHAGINRYYWNLRFDLTEEQRKEAERRRQQFAAAAETGGEEGFGGRIQLGTPAVEGTYIVKLTAGGKTVVGQVVVRDDPALDAVR